ncbi:hypothetical protein CCMSSC00406_0001818 [Pleurotus cornucopiae]|uniref:Uncharacterized protein n=1 Tax=Pleurotus cornucopiae TaxID=5321 RepID=A0ACB7J4Z3_PLECO|nr:hypothetical protein CCMSSC00406_0001818 [Pleurotus cornucopiae]
MEQETERVAQAIAIAADPAQVALHQEALYYLTTVQQNANNTWRLALSIFADATPDGSRRYSPQARFWALRLLEEFLDNRFEPLDDEAFQTLRQGFLTYIQSEYVFGSAEANASFLRNKFSHTLTLFFLCTYIDQWPTFFADIFALIRQDASKFNRHVSLLFFHLVLEISGEVADQMIKAARTFNTQRHTRDGQVRDAVRERDASQINEAVLTIIADGVERMSALREAGDSSRELGDVVEVVDWGIRTFGSYVGWIDINLTVTPTTVPLLFTLLADPSLPIRLATSVALLRIVAKGLKEPSDKLQLIKVLSLGQVIDALESKTRNQQTQRGSNTDEGEESYREALGKLLNIYGLELHKLIDDCSDQAIRTEATQYLNQILPVVLRFMADEYDDTSSTIFTLLHTVLSSYKRSRKMSSEPIEDSKRTFLVSLLNVILEKMKWEEDTDMDDPDDDDVAAFEGLRKELRSFMDGVLVIDQDLVTEAVRTLALNTLAGYRNGVAVKWNDAELAIYLVYIFGEINKSGGKGRAAFCQAPSIDKTMRKDVDYSEFPLTAHGEMLLSLVQSGISSYPHRAVVMQFFEAVTRYSDFFKVRKDCIMPTLEVMVDTRGLHSQDSTVRSRAFYLFYRFIKENKTDFPSSVAVNLVEGIRDLLQIEVELPEIDEDSTKDILTEALSTPSRFDSQIYLFETVGVLCSLLKSPEEQSALLLSVAKPLLDELSTNLQASTSSMEPTAILRVHHIIMALGNIAKGFPDFPSPVQPGHVLPPLEVLQQIAQAIIVCLEAMNVYKVVRDASRFAFARILATAGPSVTQYIPPLMANLLNRFEPSELADFMTFIGLLIHKLQRDMLGVLDELLGPLSSHISSILAQPVSGTDDLVTRVDTKRAYLSLLNSIMASKLHSVFTSERNKATFEPLLETVLREIEDLSDPSSQKTALTFFSRCVAVWGQPTGGPGENDAIPGFERFIYERLVPTAFSVLFKPDYNIKDGQMFTVLHEIANFLQVVGKTRGTEAYEYFATVFLPGQNLPSQLAVEFATKLRDWDSKAFRKYFAEFVRSSRPQS